MKRNEGWAGPYVLLSFDGEPAHGEQRRKIRHDFWVNTPLGPANFGSISWEKRFVRERARKISPVSAACLPEFIVV